ncbi:recombinase A [Thioalkalicoccus limnaeus]|uniref:Recombinase A n=1 Tax=Thioalkalicoccus limnaeus TaxID=120681 RepID=A0ABV4BE61_9GAMM
MSADLNLVQLARCSDLQRGIDPDRPPAAWGLPPLRGRFVEITGGPASAALTLAIGLVAEAQHDAEPVAWVSRSDSHFYPPDAAAAGVDLSALVVVWSSGAQHSAQAADLLLRSGAFGLVTLDLGSDDCLPLAAQTRLAALAKKQATALVCLTRTGGTSPSLGSLISLRAEARRTGPARDGFRCEARILKDKRRGPGWTHLEVCVGPSGLC